MITESVQRRFESLSLESAQIAELSLDVGEELSLKLYPNPKNVKLRGTYEKYALRFSCVRDVRLDLRASDSPFEILSYSARQKDTNGSGEKIWRFELKLSVGALEVDAEDFGLTVIQRLQVANRYIDK